MRETARFLGVAWEHFLELDTEEQAYAIAHYQTHYRIQAILAKSTK